MTLSLIAAVAKNRAIGYQNKLLFAIKEDMEHFKRLTMGHVIIMGLYRIERILLSAHHKLFSKAVHVLHHLKKLWPCAKKKQKCL